MPHNAGALTISSLLHRCQSSEGVLNHQTQMYAPCYFLQSRGDLAISSHLSPFTAIQYSHSLPSPQLHTSQTALIAQVLSLWKPVSVARFSHTAKQKLTRSSSALTCGKWEQTLIKRLPLIKHQKENKQLKLFQKKKKRKFTILQTSNSYRLTSTLTQPHHSSLPPCLHLHCTPQLLYCLNYRILASTARLHPELSLGLSLELSRDDHTKESKKTSYTSSNYLCSSKQMHKLHIVS